MNTEINYNLDYFINKFELIPHDRWIEGHLLDIEGRRCALGHTLGDFPFRSRLCLETLALTDIFKNLGNLGRVLTWKSGWEIVVNVNNGQHPHFQQNNPKDRILAALYALKEYEETLNEPFYWNDAPTVPIENIARS